MHDHHHHEPFPVEEDQPSNPRLALYGVVIIVAFFGSGIVLTSIFHRTVHAISVERGSHPGRELSELRVKERERLTTYGWVDKDKKEVRIPIDRAMMLVVEDAQKK